MTGGRRTRRTSGSVVIEFTLSVLVLAPVFLGVSAYGYSFYVYNKLVNAVRGGGRYASTLTYDSATATPSSQYLAAVQKMTVYGDPAADAATATPLAPNLTTGNVVVTMTFASGAPSTVTVAINNYTLPSVPATVTLVNKPYVWFPFVGQFGPP
jgi:Flp pilus assembly protein TadG